MGKPSCVVLVLFSSYDVTFFSHARDLLSADAYSILISHLGADGHAGPTAFFRVLLLYEICLLALLMLYCLLCLFS